MICLVRHAHAGDKQNWRGPDRLRPLSRPGWSQADGLLVRFRGLSVQAILSSPADRCLQTVAGLAEQRGLPVRLDRRLDRAASVDDVMTLIAELGDTDAVFCTHGEQIGEVLKLLRRRGVQVPLDAEYAKGSTWLLDVVGATVVGADYLPPLRKADYATR